MNKNTKIDKWEGTEEQEGEDILLSAIELSELIEQRLESKSKNKKEVNELIDEYNVRFGKTYRRV